MDRLEVRRRVADVRPRSESDRAGRRGEYVGHDRALLVLSRLPLVPLDERGGFVRERLIPRHHRGQLPTTVQRQLGGGVREVRQLAELTRGAQCDVQQLVRRDDLGHQAQMQRLCSVDRYAAQQDVASSGHADEQRPQHRAAVTGGDAMKNYERFWSERFDRLDVVLENLKQKEQGDGNDE